MKLLFFEDLETTKGIKFSREHIRRKRKAGTFPEPLAVSDNSVAWLEDEIDAWIKSLPRAVALTAERAGPKASADPRQLDLELSDRGETHEAG